MVTRYVASLIYKNGEGDPGNRETIPQLQRKQGKNEFLAEALCGI